MKTEKEKMLSGELYNALDDELLKERLKARLLIKELNDSREDEDVFFNFNCVVLDVAQVTIGYRTKIGPNAQIYSATHPIDYKERATGLESGKTITIGEDVWIGGGAIICPVDIPAILCHSYRSNWPVYPPPWNYLIGCISTSINNLYK